jgi:hypothetical protein
MKKPPKSFLQARRRDLELADQRLGDFEDRCRWLLDVFTAHDPATIARSERAVWRDNLMALVLGKRPRGGWRWQTFNENEPLDEDLPKLWRRVVALVASHRESVSLPRLKVWFGRQPSTPEDPPVETPYVRLGLGYEAEDFEMALVYVVIDLLSACTTLRECDECKRLFVANRRQKRHQKCARKFHERNRPSRAKGGK